MTGRMREPLSQSVQASLRGGALIALGAALPWAVHPLQTEAVTNAILRRRTTT